MPAPGNDSTLFDFKSASLTLEAFLLKTGNLTALDAALTERFGATPDIFNGEPVVVDLTHLASLDVPVNFPILLPLLARFKLKPVAFRGGSPAQARAALDAGLAEAPESLGAPSRAEPVVQEVIRMRPQWQLQVGRNGAQALALAQAQPPDLMLVAQLDGVISAVNPAWTRMLGHAEHDLVGSQLLALMTGAKRGEMVVDFCAGAGGKTLAMGAMMRNTGRLYAFDVSGHRLDKLKPRLARSGLSNVYAAQIAHERDERIKRLAGKIDRVLVDAPCSGLGTLRRNPDLKWRQSPQAVQELREKQLAILRSAARLLKPGGRLVYATCSLLPAENEDVVAAFQAEMPEWQPLNANGLLTQAGVARADELVTPAGHLRLWPHRHATDGFFAAAWQRPE